jgi:hypothetical protein
MRRPLIGRKDYHNFHWTRGTNSKKGLGKLGGTKVLSYVFFWEKEENEFVKEELVVMCEKMLFIEKNVCKQKSIEGSCV